MANVVLDEKEYETSQWMAPQEILDGDFHPALQFAVRSLLARRKWAELQTAAAAERTPSNDAEVKRPWEEQACGAGRVPSDCLIPAALSRMHTHTHTYVYALV